MPPVAFKQRVIPVSTVRTVRRRLLGWYDVHRRDLPWRRRQNDPYAQWVAEIMLQQTRVETVIPYYERFLKRFATLQRLARAPHEQVLKAWEGLGYYRRALHLHQAAKVLVRRHADLPRSVGELRQLPGVGDYTAAAIASIAFGAREAAVDGNVARVLARLFGLKDGASIARQRSSLRELAIQLLSPTRPGDFNQAWMDLGSAVCTPRDPDCPPCPLNRVCVFRRSGRSALLPRTPKSTAKRLHWTLVTTVLCHDGLLLVRRRPRGGLWSGLWEFPTDLVADENVDQGAEPRTFGDTKAWHHRGERGPRENGTDGPRDQGTKRRRNAGTDGRTGSRDDRAKRATVARTIIRRLAGRHGVTLHSAPRLLGSLAHELTHRSLTFLVYLAEVREGRCTSTSTRRRSGPDRWLQRWVSTRDLKRLSLSTAQRRIHDMVRPALHRPPGR